MQYETIKVYGYVFFSCPACGSLVFNTTKHDEFHTALGGIAENAGRGAQAMSYLTPLG